MKQDDHFPASLPFRDAGFERKRALAEIYLRERALVARTVRAFGLPAQDIEDVVQEVFLITALRFEEIRTNDCLKPWLQAVARLVCMNRRRALRRQQHRFKLDPEFSIDALPCSGTCEPDRQLEQNQRYRSVAKAVLKLEPKKRNVFVLAEIEELPALAIGQRIRAPLGTVQSRLRAARRQVRRALARARL
jgi:RNA polymerase sigma-70 factor, ECF subfamily